MTLESTLTSGCNGTNSYIILPKEGIWDDGLKTIFPSLPLPPSTFHPIFVHLPGYLNKAAYDVYIKNRPKREEETKAVGSDWEKIRKIHRRYADLMPPVNGKELLRHIDHVAKLVGADHVGLGSDFDGISAMVPVGVEDVSKYPFIVKGLVDLGYSDAE